MRAIRMYDAPPISGTVVEYDDGTFRVGGPHGPILAAAYVAAAKRHWRDVTSSHVLHCYHSESTR